MALTVPDSNIDPTDPRIVRIMCLACHGLLWVEKNSPCHVYGRCTICCKRLEGFLERIKNN